MDKPVPRVSRPLTLLFLVTMLGGFHPDRIGATPSAAVDAAPTDAMIEESLRLVESALAARPDDTGLLRELARLQTMAGEFTLAKEIEEHLAILEMTPPGPIRKALGQDAQRFAAFPTPAPGSGTSPDPAPAAAPTTNRPAPEAARATEPGALPPEAAAGLLIARLTDQKTVSRADCDRALALLLDGNAPQETAGDAGSVTRGHVCLRVRRAVGVRAGVMGRIFDGSERYAYKDLRFRGWIPEGGSRVPITGAELVGLVRLARRYARQHPAPDLM